MLGPVLGGLVYIGCGIAAMFVDYREEKHRTTDPVLPRNYSAGTTDFTQRPHWIWLAGSTVFAATIIPTAIWQAACVKEAAVENWEEMSSALLRNGIICGVNCFLVAFLPSPNYKYWPGESLHMLTAILFQVFGALFGSNLLSLANAFDKRDTLHMSRLVLLIVFYIGSAVSIMGGQAIGANRNSGTIAKN